MLGIGIAILVGVGGPQPEGGAAYPAEVHGYVYGGRQSDVVIYDVSGERMAHVIALPNTMYSTCGYNLVVTRYNTPWCVCAEHYAYSGSTKYWIYDAKLVPFNEFTESVICYGEGFARKAARVDLNPDHAGARCWDFNSIAECQQ